MPPVVGHALLGLAVVALLSAAVRVASRLEVDGAELVLVAAPLAAACAVAEVLLLGLAGLGGNAYGVAGLAVLTWLVTLIALPRPARGGRRGFGWWRKRTTQERVLAGAVLGAAGVWAVWQLRHPALGADAELYHLPEIVTWIQGGHTGSVVDVLSGWPAGSYPLTDEVTISWAMAIAHSFVPFVLWPWVTLGLTACGCWTGLRSLGVPATVRVLGAAAVCSSTWLLVWQSQGSVTDGTALAWLVCGAALVVLSRHRLGLLPPAVLALGLSVGVKTTTAPLAVALVMVGLILARRDLRALRAPLCAAFTATIAVAGVWYLRDLVQHGSPFWPLIAAPWGDDVPPAVVRINIRFIDHPLATVQSLGQLYVERLAGGLVLLAGALVLPFFSRSRGARVAGAACAAGALLWMAAPATGIVPDAGPVAKIFAFSTTRYLLPVLATAATAIALCAVTRRRHVADAATCLLAVATALNLVDAFRSGPTFVPSAVLVGAGAVVGALAGALSTGLPAITVSRGAWPVIGVLVGGLCALPARGLVARHGATGGVFTAPVVSRLTSDARYARATVPVASSRGTVGTLAGDALEHRLVRVPYAEACSPAARAATRRWLVIFTGSLVGGPPQARAGDCLAALPGAVGIPGFVIRPP